MVPSLSGVFAIVVVVIAAIVCGRMPLLSNPGPEAGMVLAVVGGFAIALAGAVRGSHRRKSGYFADWRSGALLGLLAFVIFIVMTTIGAAVSPSCSPSAGRLPMAILSLPVLALQAAIGPVVGRIVGRRGLAVLACVAVEFIAVASIAAELLNEPGFRTTSHFFVVISGDLLAGATLPLAAIGFRAATALLAVTVVLVGSAFWPAQKTRGLVSGASGDTALIWVGAVVVGIAFVIAHGQARAALIPGRHAMEAAYTLEKHRGNIVVHADPLVTSPRDVDALLAEATMWHSRLRARLGPISTDDIHIWAHQNRAAMARYTGAMNVDFALPWRRELHLGSNDVPHRTLGHELAHVVVGERSDTMLKVPSRFVIMHNAAVTEGVAMALSPELAVADGLTLREQAAAMRRTGKAPALERLFSFLSFFREEPGRAYVAAGALIEAIIADAADDAPQAIGRLYAGSGSLGDVSDDPTALIARHEAALDAMPLPDDATGFAAARFKRPSVLDEVCDPDLKASAESIRSLARTGDLAAALDAARSLQGDDADGTLSALLADVRDVDNVEGSIGLLQQLVDLAPTASERALRQLALGSELWRGHHEREALGAWDSIDVDAATVDVQRQILATRVFADAAVRLRERAVVSRAALAFFIADAGVRDGARLAFAQAVGRGDVDESPVALALARYVLGRQYVQQGALDAAIAILSPLVESHVLAATFHEQAVLGLAVALVRREARDASTTSTTASDAPPPANEAPDAPPETLPSDPANGALIASDEPPKATANRASVLLVQAADRAHRPAVRLFLRDRAERAARAEAAPPRPPLVTATSDPAWGDRLLLGATAQGAL